MEVLQMQQITKSFGSNKVLDNVNFDLEQGEVHALLGTNGAGKSTLMKILNGVLVNYEGVININDTATKFNSPNDAANKGISMIHQELELVENLSISQNIWLGREKTKKNIIVDFNSMIENTKTILNDLEFDLHPNTIVATLSTAKRQLVLIARAIAMQPKVIIMDEPTSSLSIEETTNLFRVIKKLKQKDISIIYISHYLEEIFQIADRVTVLRNGKNIITENIKNCSQEKIIEWMIGNKNIGGKKRIGKSYTNELVLSVKNISQINGVVKDVSFDLKKGEVLGLAGVVGSGRTEVVQIIFGINKKSKGTICIGNKNIATTHNSPEKTVKLKMGYIPEDRKTDALLYTRNIFDNLSIVAYANSCNNGIIKYKPLKEKAKDIIESLKIKCNDETQGVMDLSGGNQQKVVIGKWLWVKPSILIMDQPTRGIDIGAKEEIYDLVNALALQGMSIIYISDELEEILNLTDRILVMKQGRITDEYNNSTKEISKSQLMNSMVGVEN